MMRGVTWPPSAADILLMFPAFMIGSGLGSLVALGAGKGSSVDRTIAAIKLSAAGSAVGAVISIVTAQWWPPIIGPFILCTGVAIATAIVFRGRLPR
jgi:hypothetical protein